MTRTQIIARVARRLGDESTAFQAVLSDFFDDVLADLAASEAISDLQAEAAFTVVAGQESYSTQVLTGLPAGTYPMRVLKLTVPTWGAAGAAPYFREASNAAEYDSLRLALADATGLPTLWRTYPNRRQVQLWPPADTDHAGTGIGRVLYLRPPATITGAEELADLGAEDVETLVWGMVARGAPFRDETMADVDHALELYERGKRQLWGRLHNSGPKRIAPREF